jgi:hypothetical protein
MLTTSSPTIGNVSDEYDATSLVVGRHDDELYNVTASKAASLKKVERVVVRCRRCRGSVL